MEQGKVQYDAQGSQFYLRFCGDVRLPWCVTLESFCEEVLNSVDYQRFTVDLNSAENLDSTTLGILAKILLLAKQKLAQNPLLYCENDTVYRLVTTMGFLSIVDVMRGTDTEPHNYRDLDFLCASEDDVRDRVIVAHEQLMKIDDANKARFSSLVDTLKSQSKESS